MAQFLTTHGVTHWIEQIILTAEKSITLITPYLQMSKTLYERLKDASEKGVTIRLIYGKDALKPNERNSLGTLKTVEVYYFENLHAKCYYNEKLLVITSMNIYEFSEKNNREMGIMIDATQDKDLYNQAVAEAISIFNSSELQRMKKERNLNRLYNLKNQTSRYTRGYCLRCEDRIPYNPDKPYCGECYTSWSFWQNYSFLEKVCHQCGEYTDSTMSKPLCWSCFTQQSGSI